MHGCLPVMTGWSPMSGLREIIW